MAHQIAGLPGIKTSRTATPRDVLMTDQGVVLRPSSLVIESGEARDPDNTGNVDVLRGGLILSRNDTGGAYVSTIIGLTGASISGTGTSLTLTTQAATELLRRYGTSGTAEFAIIGSTAGGSGDEDEVPTMEVLDHSAINTSSGVVTISAITNGFPSGSLIIAGEAVQNEANGQLTHTYVLIDRWGIKVTDEDGNSITTALAQPLESGMLNTARIINYPANIVMKRWLKSELADNHQGLAFSDDA